MKAVFSLLTLRPMLVKPDVIDPTVHGSALGQEIMDRKNLGRGRRASLGPWMDSKQLPKPFERPFSG